MGRLLVFLLLGACGASEGVTVDRSAGARPPEVVAVLSGRAADVLPAELRPLAGAAVWPSSPEEALGRLLPVPDSVRVRDDSPVVLAALGDPAEPQWAAAFHGDVEEAQRTAGGPRGAALVAPHVAVDEDRLVVASSPEVLARTFAWLAYGALPQERSEGWHLELGAPAVALLSRRGEERVRGWRRRALQDIAEERARRGALPLADPEAIVGWLARKAQAALALLDDARVVRAELSSGSAGTHLRVALEPREDTPLSEILAADAPAEVPLAALPRGTALAWWRARPSDATWAELFVDTAAARLEPALAADLRGARDASPEPILALGDGPRGPWALAGGLGTRAPALEAALGSGFARTILGAALGCERADTRLRGGRAPLCGGPGLIARDGPWGWTLTVADEPPPVRWGSRGAGTLAADPQAGPVLPDRASAALYLDPARLPGALRLLPSSPGAGDAADRADDAPVVLSWRPRAGALVVDLHAAPRAPGQVAALLGLVGGP